jgi:5-deoxy-glucuronate isomerase
MKTQSRTVSLPTAPNFLTRCVVRASERTAAHGYAPLVWPGSKRSDRAGMGMEFGLLRLASGRIHRERTAQETVFILLQGSAILAVDRENFFVSRGSLFDEKPWTLHCGAGVSIAISAEKGGAEFAVIRTDNPRALPVRVYTPAEVATEDRGADLAQGACRRFVRTIFDYSTRPDSNLVVGEVVNFPGRWSSYPGHHHPQPEIYHYRFTRPQGYGHAEIGDAVFKVRDGDTTTIPGGLDHAQVSAPGYGMYYLWIVRHLPRRPYRGFTFSPEHRWLLDPAQQGWMPPAVLLP